MTFTQKVHRAFGIYGIIHKDNSLLVINKSNGPYMNRFDLPGGSLEPGERLEETLKREIREETGIKIGKFNQLGTISFLYPWTYKRFNYNQHICVFYSISDYSGTLLSKVPQFKGQDSVGCRFVSYNNLTIENSSPLVLSAKKFIKQNNNKFDSSSQQFPAWEVKESSTLKK